MGIKIQIKGVASPFVLNRDTSFFHYQNQKCPINPWESKESVWVQQISPIVRKWKRNKDMGNLHLPLFYMLILILYHFAVQTCIISLTELTAESSNWEVSLKHNVNAFCQAQSTAVLYHLCVRVWAYISLCRWVYICTKRHQHICIYARIHIYLCTHTNSLNGEFLIGFQGISPHNPIEFQWDLSGKLPEDYFAIIVYLSCL